MAVTQRKRVHVLSCDSPQNRLSDTHSCGGGYWTGQALLFRSVRVHSQIISLESGVSLQTYLCKLDTEVCTAQLHLRLVVVSHILVDCGSFRSEVGNLENQETFSEKKNK